MLFFLNILSETGWILGLGGLSFAIWQGLRYRRKERFTVMQVILHAMLCIYGATVFSLTLLPAFGMHEPHMSINLVPFKPVFDAYKANAKDLGRAYGVVVSSYQMVANILMFVPLGVLMPLISPKFRKFGNMLLLGFGLSLSIELLQLGGSAIGIMMRTCDIDDLILNTLGAVIGYVLIKMICALLPNLSRHLYAYPLPD